MEKQKIRYKYDLIADEILDRIRAGEWKVGDRLPPESKLVEEFNVSRVTLRESLKKLSMMGVLRIVQGDGTYINEVVPSEFMKPLIPILAYSKNNINEVYDARIFVESGACKLAAEKRTAEDIKKLRILIDNMNDAIAFNDFRAYSECDHQFHTLILKISGNGILDTVANMFREIVSDYIIRINKDPMTVERSMNDHWQILWAISDGDGRFAQSIMEKHLKRARDVLLNGLDVE